MFRTLAALALGLTLCGCVSGGTKVDTSQLAQFKKGATTEADVLAKLGKPDRTVITAAGIKIDVYSYVEASANAANFIPIVGLAAGGATGHSTAVTFTFGADGVLTDYTASESNSDIRTGLLNQKKS